MMIAQHLTVGVHAVLLRGGAVAGAVREASGGGDSAHPLGLRLWCALQVSACRLSVQQRRVFDAERTICSLVRLDIGFY